MTTPALLRLRERFPQSHITLLTHEKLSQLWQQHPALDDVLSFRDHENPWTIARRLRPHNFNTVLIFPNSPRSALEAWLAGIPDRVGYSSRWRRWWLSQPVQDPTTRLRLRKLNISEIKRRINHTDHALYTTGSGRISHQLHNYLQLAAVLGCDPRPLAPRLELSAPELQKGASLLREIALASPSPKETTLWLGLSPSAEYGSAKRWPIDRFSAVIREIATRLPICRWLIFGTDADRELGLQLSQALPGAVINLAGRTSLRELMALLKTCQVLLTNDSGPMHVAAALGTPVVALFGSTSAALTGPGLPGDGRHQLLQTNPPCSPCFRRTCPIDFRCMSSISVEQVVSAIMAGIPARSAYP
ncbi:MAG TPA: glycosyltransferase family 9 protein [Patescibacteria group bacterium]|nr:glycosyltransferase family 9 protein [Patescibacteria group bacterium]